MEIIDLITDDENDFTTETEREEIDVEAWHAANTDVYEFCHICYDTQLDFYECPNGHKTCDHCVHVIKKEDNGELYYTCPFCKQASVILPFIE